jgi:hypothetical protein
LKDAMKKTRKQRQREQEQAEAAEQAALVHRGKQPRQPGVRRWTKDEVQALCGQVSGGQRVPCPACGGQVLLWLPSAFLYRVDCDRCDNFDEQFMR